VISAEAPGVIGDPAPLTCTPLALLLRGLCAGAVKRPAPNQRGSGRSAWRGDSRHHGCTSSPGLK